MSVENPKKDTKDMLNSLLTDILSKKIGKIQIIHLD